MENKRIWFTSPSVAELLDAPYKQPGANQVTVKLAVSTISSGTERANLIGDVNINSTKPAAAQAKFPRSGGYSAAGTVVEVGEGVADFQVGDRVAVCWGHHAKYVTIGTKDLFKLPEEVSFSEAAVWNIATFPMAAIRKCRLEMGESAIVMGLGILGQLAVQLLHIAGAVPVIAVDPIAARREKALKLGADYAFDPFAPDFTEKVKEVSHGGANVAIEVTGNGQALNQVLDCMAKHGRVALLGCTRHSDFTVDYYHKVHGPGISLIGAHTSARPDAESASGYWTHHDDAMAFLRLCAAGRLHLKDFVEETHAPEEASEVFRRLIEDKHFPIVQFDWMQI